MARGIMADKKDRIATTENSESKNISEAKTSDAASCSCTKISTMQLFYELKQKYPDVPDTALCEIVEQNCHNRSGCIDALEAYPNVTNLYPKTLRKQPRKKKCRLGDNSTVNVPDSQNLTTNSSDNTQKPPQRPNNLNLVNLTTHSMNRPTRRAPPPPISRKPIPNQPLNVSLNVVVSPVSHSPTRSARSQPSLSFTLHQTNNQTGNVPGNPANSHSMETPVTSETNNESSWKCISNTYNIETGCHSRLEITVAGKNPTSSNDNEHDGPKENIQDILSGFATTADFSQETEIVHHQILCKQNLSLEIEKDRKRLERMQRKLQAIQMPLTDGEIEALNNEIEKLRTDCKFMAQEVDKVGRSYALGETNETFYKNIYTGQQLPMQRQQLRPHRPAPSLPLNQRQNSQFNETNEDAGWTCDMCTFQNKYTQRTCEACTMPFLSAGNQMGYNNEMFMAPYQWTPYPIPFMPMYSLPYPNNHNIQMPYIYYPNTSMPPQLMQSPMPMPQVYTFGNTSMTAPHNQ